MNAKSQATLEAIQAARAELRDVTQVLQPEEKQILRKLEERYLQNQSALIAATGLSPLEALLVLSLIEHHKEREEMLAELRAEIERLKAHLV